MANWLGSMFRPHRSRSEPSDTEIATERPPAGTAWHYLRSEPPVPRLGIGITSFNRRAMLERVLDAVATYTASPHVLFVADDGSIDGTDEMLAARGVTHLAAANRGIAWNKNRALYYLHRVRRCEVILILEDDTFPAAHGWEADWIDAVERHGHINLAPAHWPEDYEGGDGSPATPFVSRMVTGQCVGFGREAIEQVGFMDSRFRRYGFEHAEHTQRLVRSGFGGFLLPGSDPKFFLMKGKLAVEGLDKPPDMAGVAHNGPIMQAMRDEPMLRPAWRTDAEGALLRAEMAAVSDHPTIDPGPDWSLLTSDGAALYFDDAHGRVHAQEPGAATVTIGARVRGRSAALFAASPTDAPARWLAIEANGKLVSVRSEASATAFALVHAPDVGFGLRHADRYLCCELGGDRSVSWSRTTMSGWETFLFGGYRPRRTDRRAD